MNRVAFAILAVGATTLAIIKPTSAETTVPMEDLTLVHETKVTSPILVGLAREGFPHFQSTQFHYPRFHYPRLQYPRLQYPHY